MPGGLLGCWFLVVQVIYNYLLHVRICNYMLADVKKPRTYHTLFIISISLQVDNSRKVAL